MGLRGCPKMSVYRVTSQKSKDLKYSGTSNNEHSQGISVLSVEGGRGGSLVRVHQETNITITAWILSGKLISEMSYLTVVGMSQIKLHIGMIKKVMLRNISIQI
jgi:hypothetical protein